MFTVINDIKIDPQSEVLLSSLGAVGTLLIQNKSAATSVVLRSESSVGDDGIRLSDDRILEVTGDTIYVKNTGFSEAVLAIAIVE